MQSVSADFVSNLEECSTLGGLFEFLSSVPLGLDARQEESMLVNLKRFIKSQVAGSMDIMACPASKARRLGIDSTPKCIFVEILRFVGQLIDLVTSATVNKRFHQTIMDKRNKCFGPVDVTLGTCCEPAKDRVEDNEVCVMEGNEYDVWFTDKAEIILNFIDEMEIPIRKMEPIRGECFEDELCSRLIRRSRILDVPSYAFPNLNGEFEEDIFEATTLHVGSSSEVKKVLGDYFPNITTLSVEYMDTAMEFLFDDNLFRKIKEFGVPLSLSNEWCLFSDFIEDILPQLCHITTLKIVIWFDDDIRGQDRLDKVVKHLTRLQTELVTSDDVPSSNLEKLNFIVGCRYDDRMTGICSLLKDVLVSHGHISPTTAVVADFSQFG